MSPYPARIVRADLLDQAQQLLEIEGIDGLTLGKLAGQIGVKAASLYNHFESKADLLRAVNSLTLRGLVEAMQAAADAVSTGTAADKLRAMAVAYRRYAQAHPVSYALAFTTNVQPDVLLDPAVAEQLALPLQAVMAELAGAEDSLNALRGAWALLHGFVMLELGGHFRRTGDLDAAFQHAIDQYLRGLAPTTLT